MLVALLAFLLDVIVLVLWAVAAWCALATFWVVISAPLWLFELWQDRRRARQVVR